MCKQVLGLFLEPDHPRGTNAVAPATPTPLDKQATHQRICTEALEQLALFPKGKEFLLQDGTVLPALEIVKMIGMTDEAKEHARVAVVALQGFEQTDTDTANDHIMLSYSWSSQPTILRLNDSLQRRQYVTWIGKPVILLTILS